MSWHLAASVGEISPGKPKIVSVNGKEIGIFHEGGRYFAVLNFCPHFGAPICRGKVFGAVMADESGSQFYDSSRLVLRCPWHRWEFDLETGQALTPIRQRLKTYPVHLGGPETDDSCADTDNNANMAVTLHDVRLEGTEIWVKV
jgi:nitrite reductase/ring-hydroxylating ferredoxin subunit